MIDTAPAPDERGASPDGAESASELRSALRAWLHDNLTPEVAQAAQRSPDEEELELLREWNRRLADALLISSR